MVKVYVLSGASVQSSSSLGYNYYFDIKFSKCQTPCSYTDTMHVQFSLY